MTVQKQDLDSIIPSEVKERSKKDGNEWLLSFKDARLVIDRATKELIAILGLEVFKLTPHGNETVHYNGYEFKCENWEDFVEKNNCAAIEYMGTNVYGEGYVYILTSTSEREFRKLTANS